MTRKFFVSYLVVILILISIGWVSTRATFFALSSFQMKLDDESLKPLLRATLAPYLGKSLLKISLDDVEQEILETEQIYNLSLSKLWPNTLKVEARRRRGIVKWSKDKVGVVRDSNGKEFYNTAAYASAPKLSGDINEGHLQDICIFLDKNFSEIERYNLKTLEWSHEEGLGLSFAAISLLVKLGFDDFDYSWAQAHFFIKESKSALSKNVISIDAAYKQRLIVSFSEKLKISENSINLREIVRRRGNL